MELHPSLSDPDLGRQLLSLHFEPQCWTIKAQDVANYWDLGEGSFGKVYKAVWRGSTEVAVKQLKIPIVNMEDFQNEVHIMMNVSHVNIVRVYGIIQGTYSIVSEYCHQGSLFAVIQRSQSSPELLQSMSDWPRRLQIAMQTAEGMAYLHDIGIIHRDLKSDQIMITKDWNVKVGDFGLSKISKSSNVMSKDGKGGENPRWLAPEMYSETPAAMYTTYTDVYAFGMVMYELLTLNLPFADLNDVQALYQVAFHGSTPEVPSDNDTPGGWFWGLSDYRDLMRRCWKRDPLERPTFKDILKELRRISDPPNWVSPAPSLLDTISRSYSTPRLQRQASYNLPPLVKDFCGRECAMDELVQLLAKPEMAVNLVGSPGEGKTTLAIATADRLWKANKLQGGVYFADLTGSKKATIYQLMMGALRFEASDFNDSQPELFIEKLRVKESEKLTSMLILDNAEDAYHACEEELLQILKLCSQHCPSMKLLVTSVKLPYYGCNLTCYTVPPLEHQVAVNLLKRIADNLSDEQADAVAVKCDCNPCAIKVVGGIIQSGEMKVEDLIESTLVAAQDEGALSELQVRKVLKKTLDHLQTRHHEVLVLLSIFPGDFTQQTASKILQPLRLGTKELNKVWKVLERKFLLLPTIETRYKLHMLVKDYATALREESTDRDGGINALFAAAQTEYVKHYHSLLVSAADAMEGPEYAQHLSELSREKRNWFAMFSWILKDNCSVEARDMVLVDFLKHRNSFSVLLHSHGVTEALESDFSRLLERSQRSVQPGVDPVQEKRRLFGLANVMTLLGGTLFSRSRWDEAAKMHDDALTLLEQVLGPNDPQVAKKAHDAFVVKSGSNCKRWWPRCVQQLTTVHDRLIKSDSSAETQQMLITLKCDLAVMISRQASTNASKWKREQKEEKLKQAEDYALQARTLACNLYNNEGVQVATSYSCLAQVLLAQGRIQEADELFHTALNISKKAKCAAQYVQIAKEASEFFRKLGKYDSAEQLCNEILKVHEDTLPDRDSFVIARTLIELASIHKTMNRFQEAEECLRRALDIRRKEFSEDDTRTATSKHQLGSLLSRDENRLEEAEHLLTEALAVRERCLGFEHSNTADTRRALSDLKRGKSVRRSFGGDSRARSSSTGYISRPSSSCSSSSWTTPRKGSQPQNTAWQGHATTKTKLFRDVLLPKGTKTTTPESTSSLANSSGRISPFAAVSMQLQDKENRVNNDRAEQGWQTIASKRDQTNDRRRTDTVRAKQRSEKPHGWGQQQRQANPEKPHGWGQQQRPANHAPAVDKGRWQAKAGPPAKEAAPRVAGVTHAATQASQAKKVELDPNRPKPVSYAAAAAGRLGAEQGASSKQPPLASPTATPSITPKPAQPPTSPSTSAAPSTASSALPSTAPSAAASSSPSPVPPTAVPSATAPPTSHAAAPSTSLNTIKTWAPKKPVTVPEASGSKQPAKGDNLQNPRTADEAEKAKPSKTFFGGTRSWSAVVAANLTTASTQVPSAAVVSPFASPAARIATSGATGTGSPTPAVPSSPAAPAVTAGTSTAATSKTDATTDQADRQAAEQADDMLVSFGSAVSTEPGPSAGSTTMQDTPKEPHNLEDSRIDSEAKTSGPEASHTSPLTNGHAIESESASASISGEETVEPQPAVQLNGVSTKPEQRTTTDALPSEAPGNLGSSTNRFPHRNASTSSLQSSSSTGSQRGQRGNKWNSNKSHQAIRSVKMAREYHPPAAWTKHSAMAGPPGIMGPPWGGAHGPMHMPPPPGLAPPGLYPPDYTSPPPGLFNGPPPFVGPASDSFASTFPRVHSNGKGKNKADTSNPKPKWVVKGSSADVGGDETVAAAPNGTAQPAANGGERIMKKAPTVLRADAPVFVPGQSIMRTIASGDDQHKD